MIPLFKVYMNNDVSSVVQTLQSGMLTQGKKVEEFETKLKEFFDYPYILSLNSATAGLTIGLRLLNLPIGSEVLCTPLTCFATTTAVLENRLNIKWVDVDPETCNMDLNDLERKISEKTKAIIFVHWGGNPINLTRLKEIAKEIPIVEDCAHAFGATYNDTYLGKHGNIAVYSLQAIKHLTCGDGGLIFLPNQQLYNRAKLLRWFGISRETKPVGIDFRMESDIQEWGYKFHMNDINATIGLCNLPHVTEILAKHRENAFFYDIHLSNLNNVKIVKQNSGSACWLYTLKVKNKTSFIQYMNSKNITVSQVHNRNDVHYCVKEFACDLPQITELEKELICIPVGWWIDNDTRDYVVKCVKDWDTNVYEIRNLKREDKQEYLDLLIQLNGFKCDPEKFDSVFDTLGNESRVYVLISDNKIVSTLKVIFEPKFYENVAHIEDVVTDALYRNRGFASKLLNHAIREAKKQNCYKVILNANKYNVPFYTKNNFVEKGSEMCLRL